MLRIPAVLLLAAAAAAAGDKSLYDLFNPTPRELMRPLSPDRPDLTESPYTVDAGHIQIELDTFVYARERHDEDPANTRTQSFVVLPTNFKLGLTNSIDLQIVVAPFEILRIDDFDAGTSTEQEGFGDVITRLKINLWGNDGGRDAFAVMPFVKIPTNQDDLGNDSVEGGVILPYATELRGGWGLGLQLEFDVVRNSLDTGYEVDFVQTAVLSHRIVGDLSGFVEIFSSISSESGSDWVGVFDTGVTYQVTDDVVLDLAAQFGISRAAPDFVLFTGLTIRF